VYARLLDACEVVGPGAEVGVLHGAFSRVMLKGWRGLTHYTLIDLWKEQPNAVYGGDSANKNDTVQEKRFQDVMRGIVRSHQPLVSVIREHSLLAARHLANNSFAFIYLDANHYYEYVRQDLEAYYPKLMAGGMLAGHDMGPVFDYGVQRAVVDFAKAHRLRFTITDPPTGGYKEPICCSGFHLWKPRLNERVPGQPGMADIDARMCYAWWLGRSVPCSALLEVDV
jgi:hypothetical protein